jgi:hypothetical protein
MPITRACAARLGAKRLFDARARLAHLDHCAADLYIDTPTLAADPRGAKKNPVPLQDLAVRWQDVTQTVAGGPGVITGYEVIVTNEGAEDPTGFSQPIYDVHVPPTLNSLRVPVEFLEADTVYEVEVLALEESGNQTIIVGFFQTA